MQQCSVSIPAPVEGMDYDAVTQLLTEEGLLDPEDYGVSVAATFGYRSREIDPKPRKPLDELVVWAK